MNLIPCEHGTLVCDLGTSTIRFGYAGDAQPLYSIPSAAAVRETYDDTQIQFGTSWLCKDASNIEVKNMVSPSGNIDSDTLSSFFDWIYQDFRIDSNDFTLLFNQPTHLYDIEKNALMNWRKALCQCTFEFLHHPLFCIEHDSVLACFSRAVQTAAVVDCGWSFFRVTPIVEGFPKLKCISPNSYIPGISSYIEWLSNEFARSDKRVLTECDFRKCLIPPTESQQKFCRSMVISDIIQSELFFQQPQHPNNKVDDMIFKYSMHHGESIDVSQEMATLLEKISHSIPKILWNSITKAPADVHRTLWSHIVTAGGLAGQKGFDDFLEKNIRNIQPQYFLKVPPAVIRPMNQRITGGQFAVWCGGSILGSLPNFSDYCITKAEFEEVGENILLQKCL